MKKPLRISVILLICLLIFTLGIGTLLSPVNAKNSDTDTDDADDNDDNDDADDNDDDDDSAEEEKEKLLQFIK